MQVLLSVLTILVGILVLILFAMLTHFWAMAKRGKSAAGVFLKRSDVEDLLFAGKTASARSAATAWQKTQPRNPEAFMLLAKAHFQLGELVEAKRILEELIAFSPESDFDAKKYLERIQQSLEKSRPRAVE